MGGLALLVVIALGGEPIKVAAMPLHAAGLTDDMAAFYSEHFAAKLGAQSGMRVITQKDIGTLLGLERQKELLGCDDGTGSCLAELAGGLGVEAVTSGEIAKVGAGFQVNVKVLGTAGARVLFVRSSQLLPTEEQVIAELNISAAEAATQLKVELRPNESQHRRLWPLIPVAVGAVAGAISAALLVDSHARYQRLDDPMQWPAINGPSAVSLRDSGKLEQELGIALLAGCGVLLVAGLLGWLLGGRP
jgi:hypothetical protein